MRSAWLLIGSLALLLGALAVADEKAAKAFHGDPEALESAALDALRALLREDAQAARAAMDRVERQGRRLTLEETQGFDRSIVRLDQSLHLALDQARRAAGAGDVDKAFQDYLWVLKSCRQCHGDVRGQDASK